MPHRATGEKPAKQGSAMPFLPGVAVTAAIGAVLAAPSAALAAPRASRAAGGDAGDGNGRHNNNSFAIRSPTRNRGYQHTATGNAGGANSVQNALCRRASVCTVNQKVTLVRPERPEPAEQSEQPATAPVPGAVPFLSLGPYGLMLMVPTAVAPAGTPFADGASTLRPNVLSVRRAAYLRRPAGRAAPGRHRRR